MHSILLLFLSIPLIFGRGCIDQGPCDTATDYFPQKSKFDSHNYTVIVYQKYYVELHITDPDYRKPDAPPGKVYHYALVRCGCPDPVVAAGTPIIHIPVATIGNVEPDVFPMLAALHVEDRLILTIDPKYIATQQIGDSLLKRYIKGEKLWFLDDYDSRQHAAEEHTKTVIAADPEIMLGGLSEAERAKSSFPRYMYWGSNDEITPFARSEWVEIMGIIIGNTKDAQNLSDRISTLYNEAKAQVNATLERPKVFSGLSFERNHIRQWYVPGGQSNEARLIQDAGGDYVIPSPSSANIILPYDDGWNLLNQSKYWIDPAWCYSRVESYLAEDNRLGSIYLVRNGDVYPAVRRSGDDLCQLNDALEGGVLYPQYLLRDLINIFHPGTLSHQRQYYDSIMPVPPGSSVNFTNTSTYPINCQYGSWEAYGACSSSCGYGVQWRIRNIRVAPKRGGSSCSSLFDTRDCIGACKSEFNLTVLLICVGVLAVVIAILVAWWSGRRAGKRIGTSLTSLKPEEKTVMIDQLAQGNYNTLT